MSSAAERRARARAVVVADPLPDARWPLASPLAGTPVAVLDVETTALDPAEARIVEIAVVHTTIGSHEAEVVLSQRVNPGIPIPPETTKVHGITDDDVAGAPAWADVWPSVLDYMQGRVPCAFNAPYDSQVVAAELGRRGVSSSLIEWGRWLDPYVLVRGIDKFEKGKKLRDAARRRGIVLEAHGAAGDALTTAYLLNTLLEEATHGVADKFGRVRFKAPSSPSVETYLRWQRDQALEQERDFATYMYGQGRREVIDCPWHVLEGVQPPAPPTRAAEPRTGATCSSCGESLVWVITKDGRKMPCNPKVITASHAEVPGGKLLVLVFDNGDVSRCYAAPAGWTGPTVEGRVAHWASCPTSEQHRRTG